MLSFVAKELQTILFEIDCILNNRHITNYYSTDIELFVIKIICYMGEPLLYGIPI